MEKSEKLYSKYKLDVMKKCMRSGLNVKSSTNFTSLHCHEFFLRVNIKFDSLIFLLPHDDVLLI